MPKSPRSKPKRSAASAASSSAAASSSSQAPPKPALRRTLLIVGATQNGKSTFSNFMYQGKEYNETEIVFPIGNESTSKTKSPQSAAFRYRYLDQKRGEDGNAVIADKEIIFSVVDTPGIGDTSGVDEETNLQFLYSRLISMAERGDVLSGIIICSRFGALQNEEYTRNIKFYREMFKDVFHSNVIIVITNVDHTNPRWIRQKQMCGEPWERQIETQKQWIQSTLGLEADAMTVYLDAMPFDLPAATHASKIRHMILQHCRKTKIDIKKITFVKSLPLQAQHQSDIAKLQGMIEGISTGIKITDTQNGVIAAKINAQSSSIAELKQRIVDLKELRRQLNTDADYSLGTHKAEDGWHWFSRASAKFDVQRRHPITKLHVSQGWYELDGAIPSFHVRGTVKNTLWQSLSATLTLYTTNRIFFADKVANLKVEIRESKAKQREEEEELARYRENNATNNAVLDKFTAQIQELNNDIAELRKTTMTFQEARSFYSDPSALDRPEDQLPVREDESPQPETSFGRIRARIREYERLAHYLPR